eukprot:2601331-Pyramimonas_sp.AAC.1
MGSSYCISKTTGTRSRGALLGISWRLRPACHATLQWRIPGPRPFGMAKMSNVDASPWAPKYVGPAFGQKVPGDIIPRSRSIFEKNSPAGPFGR